MPWEDLELSSLLFWFTKFIWFEYKELLPVIYFQNMYIGLCEFIRKINALPYFLNGLGIAVPVFIY